MKLVIFGASITSGFWDEEGGWSVRIQREINHQQLEHGEPFRDYNMTYVRGVSGDTTLDLKERMQDDIQNMNLSGSAVAVINIGFNDSIMETEGNRVPIEETKENLEKILDISEARFDQTIVIGFAPVDESRTDPLPNEPNCSYLNSEIQRYETEIRKVVEERGLKFVPLFEALNHDSWEQNLFDGVHPNTEGHKQIFEEVRKEIFSSIELDLSR